MGLLWDVVGILGCLYPKLAAVPPSNSGPVVGCCGAFARLHHTHARRHAHSLLVFLQVTASVLYGGEGWWLISSQQLVI